MAGFAALIGGAGQGAQDWNAQAHQQRILDLTEWQVRQQQMHDLLNHAQSVAMTPEMQVDINAARGKLQDIRPGDPLKKQQGVLDQIQRLIAVHPEVKAAATPQSPPLPAVGEAATEQAGGPGSSALAGMISGNPTDTAQQSAPPAAQPSTALVSPPAQGGGAQINQPQSGQPQTQTDFGQHVMDMANHAMSMGMMPEGLKAVAQPFVSNSAELDRAKMMDQYLLKELGPQRVAAIKQATPNWDQLPSYIQAGYAASAMGVPAISVPGIALRPMVINPNAPGSSAPPSQLEANGNPIDRSQGTVYRIERDPLNGQDLWYPVNQPHVTAQTPGGLASFNPLSGSQIAPLQGAVPPAQNIQHPETLANGATAFQSPAAANAGIAPVPSGGVSVPMMPHTTESLRSVQTVGPDGKAVTELVPVSSTRTVGHATSGGGPAISPVGGGQTFEKPFTPAQSLTNEQQLNTLTRAQNIMQRIRDNSHLLDSMIESGKLALEASDGGILRAVVAKNLPLTPAESQFAADITSMAEDINLLRKPLGGAGFRSEEAWAALQGLRGSLLQHPEVSRRVMDNTIQAFEALRKPLAERAPRGGGGGPRVGDVEDGYRFKGGDPSKPESWEKVK